MAFRSKGQLIVDAKEPLTFTVENQHVKGSVVADPENCAGACALKAIPGVAAAQVRRTTTWLKMDDGRIVRYRNPRAVQKAVENFDSTAGLFPPGEYVLKPHCPRQLLKVQRKRVRSTRDGSLPAASRRRPDYALR